MIAYGITRLATRFGIPAARSAIRFMSKLKKPPKGITVYRGHNVVHMGDMFFSGMFPFVDISSGGDIEGLTRSVKDILAEIPPDAKIIPGHGPLSTVAELKLYHRMLTETTAIVRDRIKQGKTLEQIQSQALPPEWAEWGTGFIKTDRWLEIIHQSLSK